jgi:hypothetical protein
VRQAVVSILVAAVLIAGCSSAASVVSADSVQLLTGGDDACYAGGEHPGSGQLVAEGEYGTTFNGKPVMWPVGYTGRRVGAEVEVLDPSGTVRATTGRLYSIAQMPNYEESVFRAAVDCGYEWDFNDCTRPKMADACDPQYNRRSVIWPVG